jgi:hypothetical protein
VRHRLGCRRRLGRFLASLVEHALRGARAILAGLRALVSQQMAAQWQTRRYRKWMAGRAAR